MLHPALNGSEMPYQPQPQDRLDMIHASITGDPRLAADDLELRRGGVSYTIDTLNEIIERYRPCTKPFLILGDDLMADFSRWKGADEIARKAELVVANRDLPSHSPSMSNLGNDSRNTSQFPFPHTKLHNEIMDISSAMIRKRIGRGGAWRYLVPLGARLIIEDRGLYRAGSGQNSAGSGLPAEQNGPSGQPLSRTPAFAKTLLVRVENAVRETLSPGRFIHSRNTALMAGDLALRWGLDGDAAYLAGMAHDMAKPLADSEILALARRDGAGISALEGQKPALLHGRAAAVLLQDRFGVHNGDVLEAAAVHTTGRAGMGKLAMAVFIADKIEYSRPRVEPRLRELASGTAQDGAAVLKDSLPVQQSSKAVLQNSLEGLFYAVLEDNVRWLRKEKLTVAEETIKLLDSIRDSGLQSGQNRSECEKGC